MGWIIDIVWLNILDALLADQTASQFVSTDRHQNGATEHARKGRCMQHCIVGFFLVDVQSQIAS